MVRGVPNFPLYHARAMEMAGLKCAPDTLANADTAPATAIPQQHAMPSRPAISAFWSSFSDLTNYLAQATAKLAVATAAVPKKTIIQVPSISAISALGSCKTLSRRGFES